MRTLLVTGMQRSGTTLVDKLLNAHPKVSVLSQPFPHVFVEIKREFLKQQFDDDTRYPLSPLFGERRYRPEHFTAFLRDFVLQPAAARDIFNGMRGFSGQLTSFSEQTVEATLASLPPTDTADAFAHLVTRLSPRADAEVYGSKEILCEEFLPFHLERGGYAVIVVRDPRDVVTSLNHGRGRDHTGRLKPLLFNLRSWRKSVAFALHLRDQPRFAAVSYESLTADPEGVLAPLATLLGVDPFDPTVFGKELHDSSGQRWHGNSSHGEKRTVGTDSVARWRTTLTPETARFVEAACYPELVTLGMPVDLDWADVPAVLEEYEDPYPLEREELSGHTGPEAIAAELDRVRLLEAPSSDEARAAYLFEESRSILSHAVRSGAWTGA